MRVREFLTSLSRWRWAVPSLVAAGFVFAFLSENYPIINSYAQFVLITVGINVILSTSLNLVNGYMGEFSVGHAGLMSLGAYASAVLTTKWLPDTPWAFFPSVLFGGIVAGSIGFLLAVLSFKETFRASLNPAGCCRRRSACRAGCAGLPARP